MSARQCERQRSGWLRHAGPVILGIGLFGLGIWAMYRLLAPLHAGEIMRQMQAMPHSVLATALAATALGYTALIGYDFWALRYLEKRLPIRVVALGGFLGYAFGNTIGISVLSGGAVRYRIYSSYGLNAFEVAALASYIAIAMGTGLTLVGVFALALHPAALTGLVPLSEGAVRALALLGGGGTLALLYALAFSGKTLRIRTFTLSMPSPRILSGQMIVALFDSTMAALTLYVLLPHGVPDFITFMAIYATATMVGVLSHVPGGVGVFETVVMAAMPAGINPGEVAAALLLFRIIYFLLPFGVAFLIVSLNEARLAGGLAMRVFGKTSDPMRPIFKAVSGSVPFITAGWACWLGIYLLAISLLPTVRAAVMENDDITAALLMEAGTLFSAIAGIALLILSTSLARRVSGSYFLTLAAIAGGALAALMNDLDVISATFLIAAGVVLLPFRHEFYRKAKITDGVFRAPWLWLMTAVALTAACFLFFAHEAAPYRAELWTDFARSADTPRSLRAGLAVSVLLLAYTLFIALQPARRQKFVSQADLLRRAEKVVATQDNPHGWLVLSGDKELCFSEDGRAFVMFARRRSAWVALGDPIGPADARERALWAFIDTARKTGFHPVFYDVSNRYTTILSDAGLSVHAIGEEAVIDLHHLNRTAPETAELHARQKQRQEQGMSLSVTPPPLEDMQMQAARTISDAWTGREKGFTVGPFDKSYIRHFPLAVVHLNKTPIAFATLLEANGCVSVDIVRYDQAQSEDLLEFLYMGLAEHYSGRARQFSLGLAPLAGLSGRRTQLIWDRFGNIMFRHGAAFGSFEALRSFKQKFSPQWQPRYIAVPAGISPMSALADVAVLIAGGPRKLRPPTRC